MTNIYVGDHGWPIPGPIDLLLDGQPYDATGDTVTFIYRKPDRSVVSIAPVIDGSVVSYSPGSGMIDQAGTWRLRIVVITPAQPPEPDKRRQADLSFRVLA